MGFAQSWQVFLQAAKTSYDRIGRVMLNNLIWFGVSFAPFLLVSYLPVENVWFFLGGIGGSVLTLGGATAALHYVMNRIIAGEETSLGDFWQGFKSFFSRGSLLVFLGVLGFAILFFNIWSSVASPSKIIFFFVGFWVWGIVYWYSVLQFVFPLLTQQNIKVLLVLKRAALITLDNVLASAVLVVISFLVLALSVVLAAPLLIFTASFLALLQNYTLKEIMGKYQAKDVSAEGKPEQ